MDAVTLSGLFDEHATRLGPALLGCELTVTTSEGAVRVRLTEVEAYGGQGEDPGAHSFRGRTARNDSLFGPPRRTYVYLNYGIHRCLNLACRAEGTAGGVLLRAAEVLEGRDLAISRRGGRDTGAGLLSGPGRLGQGLGVQLHDDAVPLTLDGDVAPQATGTVFELAPPTTPIPPERIRTGPRVGVSGPGGGTEFPWRFWIDGHASVSPYRAARPRRRKAEAGPL